MQSELLRYSGASRRTESVQGTQAAATKDEAMIGRVSRDVVGNSVYSKAYFSRFRAENCSCGHILTFECESCKILHHISICFESSKFYGDLNHSQVLLPLLPSCKSANGF